MCTDGAGDIFWSAAGQVGRRVPPSTRFRPRTLKPPVIDRGLNGVVEFYGWLEVGDEGPRCGGEAVGFVVAFDVADAREDGAQVEAEAFVGAVGPDRSAGAEAVADGVFGALGHFADIVARWPDDHVDVPGADVQRVDFYGEALDERAAEEVADGPEFVAVKHIGRMFHPQPIGGFEIGVGRQDFSFVDPAAPVAAKPRAVGGHGEHGGQRVSHAGEW
jgi:hypothetical protein